MPPINPHSFTFYTAASLRSSYTATTETTDRKNSIIVSSAALTKQDNHHLRPISTMCQYRSFRFPSCRYPAGDFKHSIRIVVEESARGCSKKPHGGYCADQGPGSETDAGHATIRHGYAPGINYCPPCNDYFNAAKDAMKN